MHRDQEEVVVEVVGVKMQRELQDLADLLVEQELQHLYLQDLL
jgi:hypothetical protein